MEWGNFLTVLKLDQVALAGIVSFTVWAILTGRLYSRKAVDEIRGERDDWKLAYQDKAEAARILLDQNTELIRALETTKKVVDALPELGGSP